MWSARLVVGAAGGAPVAVVFMAVSVTTDGIALAPMMSVFPDTAAGATSVPAVYTFRNVGGGNVLVHAAGTSRADFVVTADACAGATLAPGQACTVAVAFSPKAAGEKAGTLSITAVVEAGCGGGTAQAAMRGTGVPGASLAFSALSLSWDYEGACKLVEQSVLVRNVGPGPTGPLVVSIEGEGAPHFKITRDEPSPLMPARSGRPSTPRSRGAAATASSSSRPAERQRCPF
jgi:hypothetical protein